MDPEQKKVSFKPDCECKRCGFVNDFINFQGLSFRVVGEILELSHSATCHALKIDDMRLSTIFKLFESQGYDIQMQLLRPGDNPMDVVSGPREFIVGQDGTVRLKRTSFIAFALKRYNIGRYELASDLHLQYSTVRRWLSDENDDVYISRVYSIAKAYGLDFHITVKPKETGQVDETKPKVIVKFINESVQNI